MQSNKDFEWLIVDDGSTDNTQELVQSFICDNKISIWYFKQENGGKHKAINKGVKEANGELFFIVDSDDCLEKDAIERIIFHYENIKGDKKFAGVCGNRAYFDGQKIGSKAHFSILDCNAIDYRFKHKMKGDMAEVFCTEVLKQYPFPEYENEKFCPEALIWNRIAQKYKLRYFNENIYMCEYLQDGLTAKIVKIRMQSPLASMETYAELSSYNIPFVQKIKAAINFWRFAFNTKTRFITNFGKINIWKTFVSLPIGWLMYLNDKRNNLL